MTDPRRRGRPGGQPGRQAQREQQNTARKVYAQPPGQFYTVLFGHPAFCSGCGQRFLPRQPHHRLCVQCYHGSRAAEHIADALRRQLASRST
jgi:hypothetical protein